MSIKQRKKDHVNLTASGDMAYTQSAGFEDFRFRHNALPEVDKSEISTEADLLGQTFSFPLFISSMTGGYTDAGAVNSIIAEFCESENLPFGVGSQRIMLQEPETLSTFSVVREKAPTAFIAANIGGAQLIGGLSEKGVNLLIESIRADAIIVHLNPLQELMQPEGDRSFKGIENGIGQLVINSPVPVIVKETGAGISGEVAQRLLDLGVSVIDTAGAGGTSWAKVENERPSNSTPDELFNDWGIPTVQCIKEITRLKKTAQFDLIASGGVRSSLDLAKALCLGADFGAAAQPVIKAIFNEGREGLEKWYAEWKRQLTVVMILLGCSEITELSKHHLELIGKSG